MFTLNLGKNVAKRGKDQVQKDFRKVLFPYNGDTRPRLGQDTKKGTWKKTKGREGVSHEKVRKEKPKIILK